MYTMLSDKEIETAIENFPAIEADSVTKEVNELFTPYLFVKREKGEMNYWSSCCMAHGSIQIPPRTVTNIEADVLYGKHNDKAACPICGRTVTRKEVGRLGKRKNLEEYKPVVIMTEKDGEIYARAYWAMKDYLGALDAPPLFKITYAMHYAIGKAEQLCRNYYTGRWKISGRVDGGYSVRKECFREPFYDNGYCSYYIFGLDELNKTALKWCQYEGFEYDKRDAQGRKLYGDFCRYMAVYCAYPRQIEMLRKAGGNELIWDLVYNRRVNRDVLKWDETDPRKAFDLTKEEFRSFRESGVNWRGIAVYKKLRKAGVPTTFGFLGQSRLFYAEEEWLIKLCVSRKLRLERAVEYLEKQRKKGSHGGTWNLWKDYLEMLDRLGRDSTPETVFMPKSLHAAHDEAVKELNLMKERERAEKDARLAAEYKEKMATRQKKYTFAMGGWHIRLPESAQEVRDEGKALCHCVGGYAERHVKGVTTILFLRRDDEPDKPVYTIEMHGNDMVQIHGYRNDIGKKTDELPRNAMAWILEPWFDWLKGGSKRDKDGRPIIREKRRKTA